MINVSPAKPSPCIYTTPHTIYTLHVRCLRYVLLLHLVHFYLCAAAAHNFSNVHVYTYLPTLCMCTYIFPFTYIQIILDSFSLELSRVQYNRNRIKKVTFLWCVSVVVHFLCAIWLNIYLYIHMYVVCCFTSCASLTMLHYTRTLPREQKKTFYPFTHIRRKNAVVRMRSVCIHRFVGLHKKYIAHNVTSLSLYRSRARDTRAYLQDKQEIVKPHLPCGARAVPHTCTW